MLSGGEGRMLHAAAGCDACQRGGYAGRTGVFEILSITPALRDAIAADRSVADLRAKAVEEGMLQFRHAALLKVARGQTSIEEVFRVIPGEHLLPE